MLIQKFDTPDNASRVSRHLLITITVTLASLTVMTAIGSAQDAENETVATPVASQADDDDTGDSTLDDPKTTEADVTGVEEVVAGDDKKPAGKKEPKSNQLIYLPYKQLAGVFEQLNATVVVPYVEYMQLWEKVNIAPKPAKLPVQAVLASAEYQAAVQKDTAKLNAKLKLRSLADGWAQLSLPFGNVAIGEWKPDDDRVLLIGGNNGQYSVLLPDKGNYEVEVVMTTRVRTAPEGKSFEIKVPAVGISTFEVSVPEQNQTIKVLPESVALPVQAKGKETRVKVNLGASDKVAVSWIPKVSDKPQMDLLTSVTNHTSVSIQDGLIHTDTFLTYDILRGSLNQVRVAVPANHRILDVTADAKMKAWKTEKQDDRQLIVIDLLTELTKALHVEVHTETEMTEDSLELGGIGEDQETFGIHALDTVREHGQLVVQHSSETTLTIDQRQGLARIEAAEIAKQIRKTNAIGFKFYSPKYRLVVNVQPVQAKITVDHVARVEFIDDEIRLFTTLNYNIERTGIFELQVRLPEGFKIDELQIPHLKDYSEDKENGLLKVLLNEKTKGKLPLFIQGHFDFDDEAEEVELELPLLTPENIEREVGRLYVLAPQSMEIITDQENLVSAQPAPVGNVRGSSSRLRPISAWSFTRRPVTIPVKTVRKPTRLSATVATTVETVENLIDVNTKLIYNVEYAGVDTFRFAVPETISEKIQIESLNTDSSAPGIKQKTAAEEAVDGWVTWTVVMQREVTGQQIFRVRYDIPVEELVNGNTEQELPEPKPETTKDKDAPNGDADESDEEKTDSKEEKDADKAHTKSEQPSPLKLQLLKPLGLDAKANNGKETKLSSVYGEAAIKKSRSLAVQAVVESEAVEFIDIRELEALPTEGFLAFRYFDGEETIDVDINLKKFAIQEVVKTVISRALVEVVTGRDKTVTYLCRYRIKTSERQRLALDLPTGAEPLALFVDNRAVELEKRDSGTANDGWDPYYIPVSRGGNSDEPFLLTIQFRWPVHPMPFEYMGGKIAVPIPQIGMNTGGVATQHLQTVVWVPKEFSLVGEPKDFLINRTPKLSHALAGKLDGRIDPESLKNQLDDWIGSEASSLVEFPTQGRPFTYTNLGGAPQITVTWWNKTGFTFVISGALLVIAFFLRATTWSNKFGFLLVTAFVVALFAQVDADRVLHGVEAARLGMIGLAGIWLIQALFGVRHVFAAKPSDGRSGMSATIDFPWANAAIVPPPGIFDDIADNGAS